MKHLCILVLLTLVSCATVKPTYSPEQITAESERINLFFDKAYQEWISPFPEIQTAQGIHKNDDKLDGWNGDPKKLYTGILRRHLEKLETFNFDMLNASSKVSYQVFQYRVRAKLEKSERESLSYGIRPKEGFHTKLPRLLIRRHKIKSVRDAKNYVSRLAQTPKRIDQIIKKTNRQMNKGIVPPLFVFPAIEDALIQLSKGFPYQRHKGKNLLYQDFEKKINRLKAKPETKKSLLKRARMTMKKRTGPALIKYRDFLGKLKKIAPQEGSLSLYPGGKKYYQAKLQEHTTTNLDAEDIHTLGLSEVNRLQKELKKVVASQGYKGKDLFEYLRSATKFQYRNSKTDRRKFLKKFRASVERSKKAIPKIVSMPPESAVLVASVPRHRAETAGGAYYQSPARKKPGMVFVNLYKMQTIPRYELEARAFHEGIPGHHLQQAKAIELNLPEFRKRVRFRGFNEGWGMYSEELALEMGLYKEPEQHIGKLTKELWMAARLVVDTGIHHYGWTRGEATDYYTDNTPLYQERIDKEVLSHVLRPGRATAYHVGKVKIMEMRKRVQKALGSKFNITRFHDTLLENGSLPFEILESEIDRLIKVEKGLAG